MDADFEYSRSLLTPPEGEPRADPAPDLLGNKGLKELLMGAICLFDMNRVKQTSVPIIVIAQSGGGKSTFFEGVKTAFGGDADIYPVDAITPGDAKGKVRGSGSNKKVIRAKLAPVSLFDEINKWQMNYIEGVIIPVFGAEQGIKIREGKRFDTSEWNTLPVGTLLPYWQDFEGQGGAANKKIHNIEQIMRRSLLIRLEDVETHDDTFLDNYIDKISSQMFSNVKYDDDVAADNYERIVQVISRAKDLPPPKFNSNSQYQEAKRHFKRLAPKIRFSDRVIYDRAFINNSLKAAIGNARRYGRHVVTLDDVYYITGILEQNAKALGIYKNRCGCGADIQEDDIRCTKCNKRLKKLDPDDKSGEDS